MSGALSTWQMEYDAADMAMGFSTEIQDPSLNSKSQQTKQFPSFLIGLTGSTN